MPRRIHSLVLEEGPFCRLPSHHRPAVDCRDSLTAEVVELDTVVDLEDRDAMRTQPSAYTRRVPGPGMAETRVSRSYCPRVDN